MANSKLTLATLQSAAASDTKLQQFLRTSAGSAISLKVTEAVAQYIEMLKELKYMEATAPDLIDEVKEIKARVDRRHKRSNVATIGGSATSLLGGAMIVGGIIAAPFTLGASVGLAAAGTAVTVAGSVATATAKTGDVLLGSKDYKTSKAKIDAFLEHYHAAKNAHDKLCQLSEEITKTMFPRLSQEERKTWIQVATNAIISTAGHVIDLTRIPKTTVGVMTGGMTVRQAILTPSKLHAATKLALTPHKSVGLTRQFLSKSTTAIKCAAKFDFSGCKLAVLSSIRTITVVLKTAGVVLTVGGMALDAYSIVSASYELYKKKECKVSQNISQHIKELTELQAGLKRLNQELAEKCITE